MKKISYILCFALFLLPACTSNQKTETNKENLTGEAAIEESLQTHQSIGEIIKIDDELDKLIAPDAKIEILANGYEWSEGPVWIEDGKFLLFSDVPVNKIYKWQEGEGASVYLDPSGYTGKYEKTSESGSNGLMLDSDGKLLICQHGDRRIVRLESTFGDPKPEYETVAHNFRNKKLNSPNDMAIYKDGSIYFTDPPYGLPGGDQSELKELDFSGVFKIDNEGIIILLTDELTKPNGIAFSPDYKICYVNVSDRENKVTMAYPVNEEGIFGEGYVFFDANSLGGRGAPDGLRVHPSGTVFSTGPGGVLVINSEGKHLGTINTTQATANCTFNSDYSYLYITADMYLLRIKILT